MGGVNISQTSGSQYATPINLSQAKPSARGRKSRFAKQVICFFFSWLKVNEGYHHRIQMDDDVRSVAML